MGMRLGVTLGFDEGGGDGVGSDSVGGEELGVAVDEAEEAGFAGGVVGADDTAGLGGDGGEHDESSPAAAAHAGDDGLRYEEGGGEIGVEDGVPLLLADGFEGVDGIDAGVVDEDVDGAELGLGGGDEAGDVLGVGDVCLDGDGLPAEGFDLLDDFVGLLGGGEVVYCDGAAVFCEGEGDGLAYAA
jgi:hypothetical protein